MSWVIAGLIVLALMTVAVVAIGLILKMFDRTMKRHGF